MREVENLEITCLVDNTVDLLLPSTQVARRAIVKDWHSKPLIGEHGFCAAVTISVNGSKHRLLFDSGLDPLVASHNVEALGFDLSYCECAVSSHGHVDHAGGLIDVRKKLDQNKKIPLVLHNEAFRNRLVKFPDGRTIDLPAPERSKLADSGYELVEKKSRTTWIADTALVTGEIPRTTDFEKGFPNHFASGSDGEMEPDPMIIDDQALVFNVKDKGLVILTGCGHAGVINTINYAKELAGEDRVYALVGGLHLSGKLFEPIIARTCDELEKLKSLSHIVPCHCTGFKAATEIAKRMPEAFIQNSVGTTYVF